MTLTHTYMGEGAAEQLMRQRSPELLIVGPAGTGKSRACLEKLNTAACKYDGMRALMLRKTQTSFTSSGLVTWERDVVAEQMEAGYVSFYGGSARDPAQYRYANGSRIVIGGMDKASKIMSTEYDLIYIQEATELTEDEWEALTTRLRSDVMPYQQLLADCNPAEETHWLRQRCARGQTVMLHSRHEDNPILYRDGDWTERGATYIARLDALSGVRYRRLRKGEWSSAEGVIYEDWDSSVHLLDHNTTSFGLTGNPDAPIPEAWQRWWAVDFGYTNPFVCQHWAEDPDGRLFLYREFYHTQRTTDRHAKDILDVVAPKGQWVEPKPRGVICDHDAEGQEVLRRELGLSLRNADKRVKTGIEVVMRRLRDAGDGHRRLYILRDSLVEVDASLLEAGRPTCTADEIPGYVWDQRAGKAPKEEPVKEDDHGCDAMRYLCMEREGRPVRTDVADQMSRLRL